MLLQVHPDNPNPRHLRTIAECLLSGGVIIYPTDTIYGLGCDIFQHKAVERIARIKQVDPNKAQLSFVCYDLSDLSQYTKSISTPLYRLLKHYLPGPYTFILPASKEVPKILQSKKSTIGLRVPDNNIARHIVKELRHPILSASLPGDMVEEYTDPEIMHTNAGGHYQLLREKIRAEHFTDVVIIGGDGTVNQVTQALHGLPVRFGIIPVGSGNGLALAARIPTKPELALSLIFEGRAKSIDAFMVNDHYSCMLSGIGFDAQVAHDFASKASRGLLTYTQQSIINYFRANPYQFEIKLDNFSFFSEAFFISIANSNQFGNNFKIAPQASLHDGMLDIVIVQKMNKAKLPFAILRQIRGNNKLQQLVEDMTQKNILYFQTPSITIRNLKHAPLHIDGEPRETEEEFSVHIMPQYFELIQPE